MRFASSFRSKGTKHFRLELDWTSFQKQFSMHWKRNLPHHAISGSYSTALPDIFLAAAYTGVTVALIHGAWVLRCVQFLNDLRANEDACDGIILQFQPFGRENVKIRKLFSPIVNEDVDCKSLSINIKRMTT